MKRIIPVILLLAGFTVSFGQGLKIGVYAEPQISWLASESRTVHSEGTKLGIDGGLVLDKYFQKNYALQTGVAIGTQGGSLLFDEQTAFTSYGVTDTLVAGTEVEYKINYITVPLGLKLKTNEIGYFSYFARLGFNNQFNLKSKASSNEGSLNKAVIEDEIFFYNLSYYVGAGFQYHLSKDTALSLALTYTNGFINLSRKDQMKLYSRAVSLRMGIIF